MSSGAPLVRLLRRGHDLRLLCQTPRKACMSRLRNTVVANLMWGTTVGPMPCREPSQCDGKFAFPLCWRTVRAQHLLDTSHEARPPRNWDRPAEHPLEDCRGDFAYDHTLDGRGRERQAILGGLLHEAISASLGPVARYGMRGRFDGDLVEAPGRKNMACIGSAEAPPDDFSCVRARTSEGRDIPPPAAIEVGALRPQARRMWVGVGALVRCRP